MVIYLNDYRDNVRKLYGCRGILVPIAQTTHGIAFPTIWTNWISAAGWLGQLFCDYFLFTGDREFLAHRAVPWLKETALFYEDFLYEGSDGRLVFSPSLSPENVPAGQDMGLLTINATMDFVFDTIWNWCRRRILKQLEISSLGKAVKKSHHGDSYTSVTLTQSEPVYLQAEIELRHQKVELNFWAGKSGFAEGKGRQNGKTEK